MLEAVFRPLGLAADEVAMVGDRIYTDIRMARDAGAVGVLTLTGETKGPHLGSYPHDQQPDVVVEDLSELVDLLEQARAENIRKGQAHHG
jgi:NagD protein